MLSLGAAALAKQPTTIPPTREAPAGQRTRPTMEELRAALEKGQSEAKNVTEGKNADYIPALAKVDPSLFGIAILTVDGRVFSVGDDSHAFSIQSISKPFVAARLMSEMGIEEDGEEAWSECHRPPLQLDRGHRARTSRGGAAHRQSPGERGRHCHGGKPEGRQQHERWNSVQGTLSAFAGRNLPVDEEIYKSEAETNTRNRSIADLLKAYEVIPGNPAEALDVYTRQCSVAVNVKDLAAMGATLAAGGVNPLTGKQVVSADVAARTLALMMTAGLYEDSGTWAFDVGVPAKSGVGGGIVAVVPGKYAVAAFSPPLDKAGNSVRAQRAIESIVKDLGGNVFQGKTRVSARQ